MINEKLLKIIILGSSSVGKTSILIRGFDKEFQKKTISTIGVDYKTQYFKFDGETPIKVNYIDTAGQEKFRSISLNYLKGTDGAMLVYDITNKESFELIHKWLDDIRENNKMGIGKILVGNKADLISEREVSVEDGKKLADTLNCQYFETSAVTGQNVREALDEIAKITYLEWQKTNEQRNTIRLSSTGSVEKIDNNTKKKKCCK